MRHVRTIAVDTNGAGDGNLEVTVTNPAGSTMYNYVRPIGPASFGVYFTPTQCGMHLVNVTFNSEVVAGSSLNFSPFSCRFCSYDVKFIR